MKPLLTKKEIVGWYEQARRSLNSRRFIQRHKGGISEGDYNSYLRSIEAYFKQLKAAFNARLKGD